MNLEARVEELISSYQRRFEDLIKETRADFAKLRNDTKAQYEEVPLGEARKVAILTECMESEELQIEWGRYSLSEIAKKYVREPASIGVLFRPDVNLLETRGEKNQRFVTEQGKKLVLEYKNKFGPKWISEYQDLLKDSALKPTYKIKMQLK
jgi:hypothetical protein